MPAALRKKKRRGTATIASRSSRAPAFTVVAIGLPPRSFLAHARAAGVARAASNPDVVVGSPITPRMSGIEHAPRLDQQQFDLVFRVRLVLDAPGHDEHLTCRDMDGAIAKVDPQVAFDHDERLVGILMVMPDKVSLRLHDLELIVIHLGNDLRLPLLVKQSELLPKIDRSVVHGGAPGDGQCQAPKLKRL